MHHLYCLYIITANHRKEKYIKWVSLQRCRWQHWSIFIRLAVFASKICAIPRNSPKIRTYSSSRSSNVIDLCMCDSCDFLLVINSNFDGISYRFQDIDVFCSK